MKRMRDSFRRSRVSFTLRPALLLLATLPCSTACHEDGSGPPASNLSDDADLTALELSAGALSTGFDPDTTDYTVDTLSGIDETTVTATTSDPAATLSINGQPAVSGAPFGPVPVGFGATSIVVEVTAEDGVTTKAYAAEVNRAHFNLISLSVPDDATWEVNREMVFGFSEAVDFTTVSSNTIKIEGSITPSATGSFSLRDERTVVFQPTCPVRADFSDAGLEPGRIPYTLRVVGRDRGATNTVRSASGGVLQITQVRRFRTPAFDEAFFDPVPGPPEPVGRPQGSQELDATHLELGGDPDQRVFFERDANQDLVLSVPGFEAPLHLYSDASTRVAFVITFDQPIHPASSNLSRLRLEFQEDAFRARTIETRATLVANCARASVRLDPIAPLPQGALLRVVVGAGFEDLVRDGRPDATADFAVVPTTTLDFTSLVPADGGSDEVLEGFDLGGVGPASLEDTEAVLDAPTAEWGGGRLSADFHEGTGGPNGNFDWVVRTGESFLFDTNSTPITGGPGGIPVATIVAVGGVVDLRSLVIEQGGTIRVQGPNPMRILATGEVRIEGRLDLSGENASDVLTLNTGNQVELGAAGAAGGGRGGNANDNVTGPTPRGGSGQGPFGQVGLGGQGGEMGFSSDDRKNARRPGGGGGGRFSKDWNGTTMFVELSLKAGIGNPGNPGSTGAVTGLRPASGGAPGEGPFRDVDPGNDFFGVRPVVTNGEITGVVHGELPSLWAGHGGGGGGNAGRFFPNPNWNFASDEKGGAGGGGGGALHVKALGPIVFGAAGEILANGGRGGLGENTSFLDHIGGTGGGGSGGHVILESATHVDFTDGGANVGQEGREIILCAGPILRVGPTEDVDTCGESGGECCPGTCNRFSNGGAGGGGLIQIHVPDPAAPPDIFHPADIRVPAAALLATDVLDQVTSPPAVVLMPTIANRSRARSKWISIGEADREPGGARGSVKFLFAGLDPTGEVQTQAEVVPELAALLQGDLEGSATVSILPDGVTLALRGTALDPLRNGTTSGLSNDLYLRSPALLREFVLRIDAGSTAGDFVVTHATYDEGGAGSGDEELRITVATGTTGTLQHFFDQHAGEPGVLPFQLIPRFFRVVTAGFENFLPSTAFVRIQFQAAAAGGPSGVDEENPLVDWTGDISRFNALAPGALRFFRFQVEFELDPQGQGFPVGADPVSLDFLRIPFVF